MTASPRTESPGPACEWQPSQPCLITILPISPVYPALSYDPGPVEPTHEVGGVAEENALPSARPGRP